jgi:hypothetical protein
LLPATLGELHLQIQQYSKAIAFFHQAFMLTKSAAEQKLLQQKIWEADAAQLQLSASR